MSPTGGEFINTAMDEGRNLAQIREGNNGVLSAGLGMTHGRGGKDKASAREAACLHLSKQDGGGNSS